MIWSHLIMGMMSPKERERVMENAIEIKFKQNDMVILSLKNRIKELEDKLHA